MKRATVKDALQQGLRNWPEAFGGDAPLVFRIHRIHQILDDIIRQTCDDQGLQESEFSALATLKRADPPYTLSPTALYRSMLYSSGGLTKVLARLESTGLIDRIDDPQDGRGKLVRLNPAGEAVVEKLLTDVRDRQAPVLSVLDEHDKRTLDALLSKVTEAWEG